MASDSEQSRNASNVTILTLTACSCLLLTNSAAGLSRTIRSHRQAAASTTTTPSSTASVPSSVLVPQTALSQEASQVPPSPSLYNSTAPASLATQVYGYHIAGSPTSVEAPPTTDAPQPDPDKDAENTERRVGLPFTA
ncbi:hypothetical protein IAT40_005037 [Kwoniella sp. CBS 6097]